MDRRKGCNNGGVKIGDEAIISANAVVTHDVSPYSIAVGCPVKVVKTACKLI